MFYFRFFALLNYQFSSRLNNESPISLLSNTLLNSGSPKSLQSNVINSILNLLRSQDADIEENKIIELFDLPQRQLPDNKGKALNFYGFLNDKEQTEFYFLKMILFIESINKNF